MAPCGAACGQYTTGVASQFLDVVRERFWDLGDDKNLMTKLRACAAEQDLL